jgi:hypothetical protein
MRPKQKISKERIGELQSVLGKIPGSERKDWILEVYDQVDGEDRLADVIDIKSGRSIKGQVGKNKE